MSVFLLAALLLAGCLGKKKTAQQGTSPTAEPDKVLYERALDDIKHGRHGVARLSLQTLINTYPDSEYLAKAKLGIADSYYKEGGKAGLLQAIQEYKDFETFFPFLHEAAYAQMQVGMAHYRQMEKPDRDRTEARLAEEEFQTFLQKFPQDERAPEAEQKLRDVQEVLAEGDYRIAHFYTVKGSYRAAGARLIELANRYPLYSQADKVLWSLGNIFERSEHSEIATQYYAKIVRNYPLSDLVGDAKAKLEKLGVPVPQPDPEALARQQRDREIERNRPGLLKRATGGILKTGPNVSSAARVGAPTLTPASETAANTETLTPPAPGAKSSVGGGGTSGTGVTIVPVTPGTQPGSAAPNGNPPPDSSANGNSSTPSTDPAAKPDPTNPSAKPGDPADPSKPADAKKDDDKKKKDKESTSKKKKGLRKIIPW